MLQKTTKLNKLELITLLSWLKGDYLLNKKKFKYEDLLMSCFLEHEDIDVCDHFDDIMLELYPLYDKLSNTNENEIRNKINNQIMLGFGLNVDQNKSTILNELIDESIKSYKRFLSLYERLISTTKFEKDEIKEVQKRLMNIFIEKYISSEDYEKCLELKENMKYI